MQTNSFDVHYLQTPTLFGDFRLPRERPAFSDARSFADLADDELLALAKQRGFTGTTAVNGAQATWHHEIDFQPPDTVADIGLLERIDDDHMYEHAPDSSYVESWRSSGHGEGKFLAMRAKRSGRIYRVLLIVGDHFMYVRNRERDLPMAESLDSLIAVTRATRAQIVEYLDCEFSVGRIHGGTTPWEIQRSTLPWREGKHLDFADSVRVTDATVLVPDAAATERWSVPINTFSRVELLTVFPSPP